MTELVYLDISSFVGMSIGARHYYGRLIRSVDGDSRSVEVTFKLTADMAAWINMLDGHNRYDEGDDCTRFMSPAEVVEAGIALFKSTVTVGVLLGGSPAYAEPHKVLCIVGLPDEIMTAGNKLYEQMEAHHADGGWNKHEAEMGALCDQWDALVAEAEEGRD